MIQKLVLLVVCQVGLLAVVSCRHDKQQTQHPHQSLSSKPGRKVELSPETLPGTCLYGKRTYRAGQTFRPDSCTRCSCPRHGGRARCTIQDCRAVENCIRWKEGEERKCCPTCLETGCLHSDGKVYRPGVTIPVKSVCESCYCQEGGGRTVCKRVACPRVQCVDAVQDENQCCQRCPNGNNCWYRREVLAAGAVVRDGCRRCSCPEGPPPHWLPARKLTAVCSMTDAC